MAQANGRNDAIMKRMMSSPGKKKEAHLKDPLMHSPDRSTTQVIGKKLK